MKRVSLSKMSTTGSPTSRNIDATMTKLLSTVSVVQVLRVGTGQCCHKRQVRRSMCTCRKSWPERSGKSRLIHPPLGGQQRVQQAGRQQAVCRAGTSGRCAPPRPGHHT